MRLTRLDAITLATVAGLLVLTAASWEALPDRVATHWELDGHPDGFDSKTVAVLIFSLPVVALAIGALLAGRRGGRSAARLQAWLSSLCVGIAAAAAMVLLLNATGGPEPEFPRWGWGIVVVTVAISLAIALGSRLTDTGGPPAVRLLLRRRAKDSICWSATEGSNWALPWGRGLLLAAVAVALLGILATTAETNSPILTVFCLLAAVSLLSISLSCLAFVSITVRVEPTAVTISYGGRLQCPVTYIPLPAVDRVEVVELIPQRHGGWGYRGGIRQFGHASVILGRGPGLHFQLRDGTIFNVSLDDAEAAKQVIDSLLPSNTSVQAPSPGGSR